MGTTPGPELSSAEMGLGPLQQLLRRQHRKTHTTTTVKGRGCVGPGAALSGGLLGQHVHNRRKTGQRTGLSASRGRCGNGSTARGNISQL